MYLVYSADGFLLRKQVDKIVKKHALPNQGTEVRSYSWIDDNLNKIYEDINTVSLFEEQKIIIINDCLFLTDQILDEKKFPNKKNKELMLKILASTNEQSVVIFTVQATKISGKNKLAKTFEKDCKVISIPQLGENELTAYVEQRLQRAEKRITHTNIEYFLNLVPQDLVVINNEIEKLIALNVGEINKAILEENVGKYRDVNIFKISEYFINNETKDFINELDNYFELNNDFVSLIYLLVNELTFTRDCLLLKQQRKNQAEIATLLNVHPYRVKIVFKKNNRLDINALNDKILVLYDLNGLLIQGSVNPEIISKLELIKVIEREN